MSTKEKFLTRLCAGTSDHNIEFLDLTNFLISQVFQLRIRGDHFIFTHPEGGEPLNLQPKGHLAKAYQVRQVRGILLKQRITSPPP